MGENHDSICLYEMIQYGLAKVKTQKAAY